MPRRLTTETARICRREQLSGTVDGFVHFPTSKSHNFALNERTLRDFVRAISNVSTLPERVNSNIIEKSNGSKVGLSDESPVVEIKNEFI
jgi:hypothetical protein